MSEQLCGKGIHPRTAEHGKQAETKRTTAAGGTRTEHSWRCNTCTSARKRNRRAELAEEKREERVIQALEDDTAHLYEHSIRSEEWRERAQCSKSPDVLGFISTDKQLQREAKLICATCPVVQECLESALSMPWFEGVAGGESIASNQNAVKPEKGMPYIVGAGTSPLARKQTTA